MTSFFRNLTIKNKLLSIQLFSGSCGLFLATIILIIFEVSEFKQSKTNDITAMAGLIAHRSTAALIFNDVPLAKANLTALTKFPIFQAACIYDVTGSVFASIQSLSYNPAISCSEDYNGQATFFEQTRLYVYHPIVLDSELIGTLLIKTDLRSAFIHKLKYISVLVLVLFLSTVISFLLSLPLINVINMSLKNLLYVVNKITYNKDYSQRANKESEDELGALVEAFNTMLTTVEAKNKALTVAKDHYLTLYNDNPTMVFNLSIKGAILSANKFGAKQLSVSQKELQSCSIFEFIHPEDHPIASKLFKSCIHAAQKVHKQELRMVCKNGEIIWVRKTARLVVNEHQQDNFLLVGEDISENRMLSEKIYYQARHDALTGLINRSEFDIAIQRAVDLASKDKSESVLCYLDLDQFKVVNDTCGHLAGDELLRQLGALLKAHIRKEDVLARLGGDEFGILMAHCTLTEAFHACEQLRTIIKDFQFCWQDRSFSIGVSIGISLIDERSGNPETPLLEAGTACYAAKEKGRNRVHLYKPDDEELASLQGEIQWVEKIQQGIENNHFVLYGQLIVPLANTQEGLHFETLVRYQDEQGNILPPGAFLPAAERYTLASSLDKWVIKNLFQWLDKHPDCLEKLSLCSINLSGLSMSDESMQSFIMDAFHHYNIPTHKICFEITETAAIANLTYATQFINSLREQKCSFSLDDFGSGLSSFAYLKYLPVDFLKIDGAFVKDIIDDRVDLAMVRSINEVGHIMGKKTIAEFVENQEIFDILHDLGIDYAQGYGIAKPVPLMELPW